MLLIGSLFIVVTAQVTMIDLECTYLFLFPKKVWIGHFSVPSITSPGQFNYLNAFVHNLTCFCSLSQSLFRSSTLYLDVNVQDTISSSFQTTHLVWNNTLSLCIFEWISLSKLPPLVTRG